MITFHIDYFKTFQTLRTFSSFLSLMAQLVNVVQNLSFLGKTSLRIF